MNLLDLRGPEFLGVYLIFFVVAVVLGLVMRSVARRRGGGGTVGESLDSLRLTPIQVAYVTGGKRLAMNTAIASLYHRQAIRLKGSKIEAVGLPTRVETDDPLEEDVYRQLVTGGPRTVRQIHQFTDVSAISRRPIELGLALPLGDRLQIGVFSIVPAGVVLLLGLAKIGVGLDRNRPVSVLVVLCIITVIAIVALMATTPLRTRAGDAMLADLKRESIGLRTTAIANPRSLEVAEFALAMGLFGPAVLAAGELGDLKKAIVPPNTSAGSSCGGASCGSGCGGGGGGGGCGGGGCGGGGCGGCGA